MRASGVIVESFEQNELVRLKSCYVPFQFKLLALAGAEEYGLKRQF